MFRDIEMKLFTSSKKYFFRRYFFLVTKILGLEFHYIAPRTDVFQRRGAIVAFSEMFSLKTDFFDIFRKKCLPDRRKHIPIISIKQQQRVEKSNARRFLTYPGIFGF